MTRTDGVSHVILCPISSVLPGEVRGHTVGVEDWTEKEWNLKIEKDCIEKLNDRNKSESIKLGY